MSQFFKTNIASWIIYPFVMCSALLLFFIFRNTGDNSITATYISIVVPSLAILLFEVYLPYKKEWKPVAADWKNDSISLVAIQMLLPKLLVWLSIHYIIKFLHTNELTFNNAWPHHLPIGVQVIIVILISDLLRYWLHRFSHTFHFLWRLHAVHHSVQKLYWLNTSRFHPLEKSLQFMLDVLPFMILGVSEEVIALHYVLYAVNGFFQHCNIDLKYGWLNYLVSSSEHHRWHHSRNPEESNNNYGNNVIIWDILFGSFYLPPDKEVQELGLINKNYPLDFARQLKTPLFNKYDKIDMPELSMGQYFLNILFRIRMVFVGFAFKNLVESTKKGDAVQLTLLRRIVSNNRNTSFGKKHSFESITNYDDYKRYLPVSEYDVLRPYIEMQAADQTNKAIVNDEIIMFNKTSGTTSNPKYIPVTSGTLKALKRSQSFLSYVQYQLQPDYFIGKLAGIVSPAVEGQTENKILYGAASGHFYKSMPAIIRFKYALPYEVFEIADYESKYYCILLLLLQHRDITYFGSANPTTYLKLIEILNSRKRDLLHDLKSRTLNSVKIADNVKAKTILRSLKPSKSRLLELERILSSSDKITFKELWPYIKLLTTWTSGSCGVALKTVLNLMPEGVKVVDPGYLSSEARGTFTFDVDSQSGMLTFHDNFFEFVERSKWEDGIHDFQLMQDLKVGREYYIFITTQSGLYRYHMNDVITVTGFINQAPLVKFLQKGKGACNITGEKLYESQVLKALDSLSLNIVFAQVLADVESCRYECFLELTNEDVDTGEIAGKLDEMLSLSNVEYKEKRAGGRLNQIIVSVLKTGTYEMIKNSAIGKGQKDGQYKMILLQYKHQFSHNLADYIR